LRGDTEAASREATAPMQPATPRSPLLAVAVAFASGIAWNLYAPATAPVYLALASVPVVATLCFHRRAGRRVMTLCLLLAVACAGALRHHAAGSMVAPAALARLVTSARQLVQLEGVIATAPQVRPPPPGSAQHFRPTTRWQLRVETIRRGNFNEPVTGRLWVIVRDRVTRLRVGDRVSLTGWLERASTARNPGGFDMSRLLARRGLDGVLVISSSGGIRRLGVSSGIPDRFARSLAGLRRQGTRLLKRHLSPRTAPVAAALLLGVRDDLDRGHREMFIRSGTMHLLAISGLHVGLLAGLIWMLARLLRLGPASTTTVIVVSVIGYALLAELRPSVLRAAILVTISVLGHSHRRTAASANSLALAALIILGLRPGDLLSPGAQLSFLAVAALTWSAPRVAVAIPITHARGFLVRVFRRVLQAWLVGVVIWCVTAPLVASEFGLVAPVGLLINVVMIPLVGMALWLGVALLVLGGWVPGAGVVLGLLLDGLLRLVLAIASTSAAGPLAFVETPAPPRAWLVLCYLLLAMVAACRNRRLRSLCLVGWTAILTAGLAAALRPPVDDGHLQLVVLDTGHGGALLLECPNGRTLLFDAGTLGDPDRLAETIRDAAWHRRRRRIDALVLSHADRDHFAAAPRLIELLGVGSLVASRTFLNPRQPETLELCTDAATAGVAIELVVAGDQLRLDPAVTITVRHPPTGFVGSSDNSNSVVLEIVFAGVRILLTGDLEDEGQGQLMSTLRGDVDVLMSPHHGSPTANRKDWAQWARAEWVLVSGGRSTTGERLRTSYLRPTTILSTRGSGAIEVTVTAAGEIKVTTATR